MAFSDEFFSCQMSCLPVGESSPVKQLEWKCPHAEEMAARPPAS